MRLGVCAVLCLWPPSLFLHLSTFFFSSYSHSPLPASTHPHQSRIQNTTWGNQNLNTFHWWRYTLSLYVNKDSKTNSSFLTGWDSNSQLDRCSIPFKSSSADWVESRICMAMECTFWAHKKNHWARFSLWWARHARTAPHMNVSYRGWNNPSQWEEGVDTASL